MNIREKIENDIILYYIIKILKKIDNFFEESKYATAVFGWLFYIILCIPPAYFSINHFNPTMLHESLIVFLLSLISLGAGFFVLFIVTLSVLFGE